MANFVMPKRTTASEMKHAEQVDPDNDFIGGVAVQRGPIGDIAVGAATVVVTNAGDDSISLLDIDTLRVRATIPVEGEPFTTVVTDDRAYVSTSSTSADAVSVVDTNTKNVIAAYPLAFGITALAVSPDGKRIYAGRTGRDHVDVAVIDTTAERVGTIDITTGAGIGIDALDVDRSGKRLYVATTDAHGSRLVVVNTETARVQRTVWVGPPIRDLALADGTAYVLTSDRARGGTVSVIDLSTDRITDTIELGGAPTQIVLSPDKTRANIVDYDRVAVLCTLSLEVINSVTVGAQPSSVAVNADGDRLYVADYAGGVAAFAVESTMPQYSQFVATDPIALPRIQGWHPHPRRAATHSRERPQNARETRRVGGQTRLLVERGSAPLVAGLGAACLPVVRMPGDGAFVGEALEIAPGGHPRHADLLGGGIGGDAIGRIPHRASDLVVRAGRCTLRRRGLLTADPQLGQRTVDLRLAGRVGSGGQGFAIATVALEPIAKCRERERLKQVRQRPVADRGAHHLEVALGGDRDDVRCRPQSRQRRCQCDPAGIGQPDVQQHQLDRFSAAEASEAARIASRAVCATPATEKP